MVNKILLLLIVPLISCACTGKETMIEQVRIYYVPIGAETYIPITFENIASSYVQYGEVDINNRSFKKLLAMLKTAKPGNFETDKLRTKIVLPDENTIYIDNRGGIIYNSVEYLKLSDPYLDKAKKILENLTSPRKNKGREMGSDRPTIVFIEFIRQLCLLSPLKRPFLPCLIMSCQISENRQIWNA